MEVENLSINPQQQAEQENSLLARTGAATPVEESLPANTQVFATQNSVQTIQNVANNVTNSTLNIAAMPKVSSGAITSEPSHEVLDATSILGSSVNSLSAVASAINNLNQMVDPHRKAMNRRKNQYIGPSATMILTNDDLQTSEIELPEDNMLALADRVFAYVDNLKNTLAEYNAQITKSKNELTEDKLLEVKALAHAVSSDAIKNGQNVQNYPSVQIPVVNSPEDSSDPFAGGHSEQLNRVTSPNFQAHVAKVDNITQFNQTHVTEDLKKQQEISSLVSAIKDDAQNGDEDESLGQREKSYSTVPITTNQDVTQETIPENIPETKQDKKEQLYADGVPVGFVDGLREGESMEDMLRRVQQSALEQLNAEENDIPYNSPSQEFVQKEIKSKDVEKGAAKGVENVTTLKSEQEFGKVQNIPAQPIQPIQDVASNKQNAQFNKNTSNVAQLQDISTNSENAHNISAKSSQQLKSQELISSSQEVSATIASVASTNIQEVNSKLEDTTPFIPVQEMSDPFADEDSTIVISSKLGSILDKAVFDIQETTVINSPDEKNTESQKGVVGAVLRSQLGKASTIESQTLSKTKEQDESHKGEKVDEAFAKDQVEVGNTNLDENTITKASRVVNDLKQTSQQVDQPSTSEDQITPKIEEIPTAESTQDSVAFATEEVPLDEDYFSDDEIEKADLENADLNATSAPISNLDYFREQEEPNIANTPSASGIQPLADGSDLNVPIAERYERERIENSSRKLQGHMLQPEDFLSTAEKSDLWACDFKAAGYGEGALYSALCSSVRKIDPSDPDRWIVVLSESFRLFALDPSFTAELNKRFQALKKRPIEISVQLCSGLPDGCVRTLALKFYDEALNKARQEFMQDKAIASIAQLAGADLRSCAMKLFKQE